MVLFLHGFLPKLCAFSPVSCVHCSSCLEPVGPRTTGGRRDYLKGFANSRSFAASVGALCQRLCFCDKCSANLCAAVTGDLMIVSLCVFSQLTGPQGTTIWMRESSMVVGAFSNFAKSLRPSVRPHETAVLPPPPGRVFMILDICGFSENLSSKFKFH